MDQISFDNSSPPPTIFVEVGEPVPLRHVTGNGRAGVPALEADVGPAKVEVGEGEHVVQLHVYLLQDREHLLVDWVELKRAKFRLCKLYKVVQQEFTPEIYLSLMPFDSRQFIFTMASTELIKTVGPRLRDSGFL